MSPGMAATHLLPDVVGEAHARELLLTGRTVDAEEALRLGLVSRVFADEELRRGGRRDRRGHRRHGADPQPLHHARPARGGHRDLEAAVQWEALAQPVTLATADLQEGIRAAREKRAPGLPRGLGCRARTGVVGASMIAWSRGIRLLTRSDFSR